MYDPDEIESESINASAFVSGVALNVALTKLASYLIPYKLYFSFTNFLYAHAAPYKYAALVIQLAIPVLVG